jgi:cytochrome b6-f complex iron-sulfur subunit
MSQGEGAREAAGAAGAGSGPGSPGRRTVLEWLIGGFLSLWGLAAALVGVSFLKAPSAEERHSEGRVKCGPFSSLPVGGGRLIRHGAGPLIVVRASETQVQAFSAICTHLRCVLQWDEKSQTVLCPCHAGAFDRRGNVLSGPPSIPLRQYPADVRADEIVVHLLG